MPAQLVFRFGAALPTVDMMNRTVMLLMFHGRNKTNSILRNDLVYKVPSVTRCGGLVVGRTPPTPPMSGPHCTLPVQQVLDFICAGCCTTLFTAGALWPIAAV